jgi:hypothetical protein
MRGLRASICSSDDPFGAPRCSPVELPNSELPHILINEKHVSFHPSCRLRESRNPGKQKQGGEFEI